MMSDSQETPKVDGEVQAAVEETEEQPAPAAGDGPQKVAAISQVYKNPEVLAALQGGLARMVGESSGYIESLPKVVKRKLKALKKLQYEMIKIESKFYEEVHNLECRYATQYAPLTERRRDIVTGSIEPTDSDCEWPSDEEDDEEIDKEDLKNKAKVTEVDETKQKEDEKEKEVKEEEDVTGVPEFWLTVFKNVDMLSDMVQEHDEPIIKHLQNIKVNLNSEPIGFTLEFVFEPNDNFTNTVLTKHYEMRSEPDESEPFSFEGPEIIKCKGCTIDWKKGKNVTVKLIKKTQKHKGRGTKRTVTKPVPNDSFFNFFSPPEMPDDEDDDDDENSDTEALLAADFEIGHFIRERIVPRAVLYFTGEALVDDEEEFDEEEGEGNEGEEGDYDEDEDPDFEPAQGAGDQKPPECKQQ